MKLLGLPWALVTALLFANTAHGAGDQQRNLAHINAIGLKQALAMATSAWKGSIVYVSIGDGAVDPSEAILRGLADGVHVFKPSSKCPRQRVEGRTFCRPKKGEVEVFVGVVRFVDDALAEAGLGYGFGAVGGVVCSHRFRRVDNVWSLVPPQEFAGLCKVS